MKFKIGDKVKVVDEGKSYTTYSNMANILGATKWDEGIICKNGDIGILLNQHKHEGDSTVMIALVDFNGSQRMISTNGLELVEEKKEHKFKIGDRVIINEQDKYFGKVGIVTKEAYGLGMGGNVTLTIDGEEGIIVLGDDLALVETPQREEVKKEKTAEETKQPKQKLMKKVSTLARKLFDADTRVLVEAGYLFDDLTLSSEGKNVLLDMLFVQYKKQMATEARKAIREAKKQCEEDEDEE